MGHSVPQTRTHSRATDACGPSSRSHTAYFSTDPFAGTYQPPEEYEYISIRSSLDDILFELKQHIKTSE